MFRRALLGLIQRAHPALDRVDQVGAQRGGGDRCGRPSRPRPRARRCGSASNSAASSPSFSRAHLGPQLVALGAQAPALGAVGGRERSSSSAIRASSRVRASTSRANTTAAAGAPPITDACAPSSAIVSRSSFSAAREDHERAAVEARDDAERDRAVEVDDRAADLGAVLELQPAHRLRRAVEAGEVGEHDQRAPARRGVDRARDLLRRGREQRARRPLLGAVGRDGAEARQRPRLDPEQRHRPAAEARVPDDRDLGLAHPGPALERLVVAVGHRAHHRADVERLLAARVGRPRRRSRRPSRGRSPAPRAARAQTSRSAGSALSRAAREALARRDVGVLVVAQQHARTRRRGRAPSTAPGRSAPSRARSRRCRSCPPPRRRRSSRAPACRSAPSRSRASSRGCRACASASSPRR